MVNIVTINHLPEAAEWADIPRLENGWWPTGGAVDPENDGGIMNWQAQVLINRTAWLKAQLAAGLDPVALIQSLRDADGPGSGLDADMVDGRGFDEIIASVRALFVGTVSQVGGNPTGAVIETGANANGNYTKFADGTLICKGISAGTLDANSASASTNNMHYSNFTHLTFPVAFAQIPKVIPSTVHNADDAWAGAAHNLTTADFDARIWSAHSTASAWITYTAFGSWF